jgi:hypothetical protein
MLSRDFLTSYIPAALTGVLATKISKTDERERAGIST